MVRAKQVKPRLEPEFPSFIKVLLRSHVDSCFWMGIPVSFCKSFLPKKDAMLVLENKIGQQSQVKYLPQKTGLSGGWRSFAVGHNLLAGDVLIFHLIESLKFKVYIIRANDLTKVDGDLGLQNLESHVRGNNADTQETTRTSSQPKKRKRQKTDIPLTETLKKKRTRVSRYVPMCGVPVDKPIGFEGIKSFLDFHIVVNGLCIDTKLPEDVRVNYYELCLIKKSFLHDHLSPTPYFKLVAGIIGETVGIANRLKACKFMTTSREDFADWEKSLKSFKLFWMSVEFLQNRLQKLQSLAFGSGAILNTKRYVEANTEQSRIANEIRKLEARLVEMKEVSAKLDAVIDRLKQKAESYEAEFQKEVDTPW